MHDLALYRKYRPGTFKEVVGQNHIVDVLESSIKTGKVSHAYLFVGSRGTGKTSVARIFAKEIGVSANDLYEIDAASNRGIDDIRELRDGVRTLPFDSKYKVYIIDEVHMLSKDAWGALLKTLEEPPKHAIFILATTELHKVPDTIISRCQVFSFNKASDTSLKKVILDVAKQEGFELDTSGAELIGILGDGSYRDTLGVLQKILNFYSGGKKGTKVSREDVEKITHAPQSVLVNDFLKALVEQNTEESLRLIQKAGAENLDMKLYLKLIIQKFRVAIIARYAPKLLAEMSEGLNEKDIEFLQELISTDKGGIIRSKGLVALLGAYQNIDRSFVPELPLELAVIEIFGQDSK